MLLVKIWKCIEKKIIYLKLGLARKLNLIGISLHKNDIGFIEANKRTVKDYEVWGFVKVLGISYDDLFSETQKILDEDI